MTFLISLETPGRGSYIHAFIQVVENKSGKKAQQLAQEIVIEALVSIGIPKERLAIEVTTNSSISIGVHRINIIPVEEFNGHTASKLAVLLL